MGVVRLADEVGERELELVRPQAPCAGLRRKAMAFAEEEQDVRRLSDQSAAGLQERRRKRQLRERIVGEHGEHAGFATVCPCDIDVARASLFERKPHEFTAPLDGRPVVEFVTHGVAPSRSSAIFAPVCRFPVPGDRAKISTQMPDNASLSADC
jgi:hypothetical protein